MELKHFAFLQLQFIFEFQNFIIVLYIKGSPVWAHFAENLPRIIKLNNFSFTLHLPNSYLNLVQVVAMPLSVRPSGTFKPLDQAGLDR